MQEIRDRVLAILQNNFNSQQLQMIDLAVAEALKGYKVETEETLPAVREGMIYPEVYEYLARKKSKGLDKGTIEQYKYVLESFCYYCQKPLVEVIDYDVIKFLDDYETYRCIKKRRKDGMRVILNGFFTYLINLGKIRKNPMITIDTIKFEKKIRQALSDIELEKVRRSCITERERALIAFLFATGCRVSEVKELNRSDIDYDLRQIKVFGKGKKERIVFLNAEAIVALDEYFKKRTDSNDALFVSERKPNQRIKKNAIEKIVRKIGERAGLNRRLFPHLLRHTCATFLLRHGMALECVQDYLGHENVDTTRIYAKSDPERLKAAYKACMAA